MTTGRLTRVVLVEDHPAVREHLVAVLDAAGLDVIATAGDLGGGHETVLRLRPDVVVVDNRLPDGGGFELCEVLLREVPEVALVVHSGAVTGAETERALALGVHAVVPKSLRGHDLVDAVRLAVTDRRPAP
ncbi:response regulator [Actinomycetospora endophytica]|uniref:Response regulator n=1 Tax=Actinomycetospora endophytica TaxID=2291215 RepID=A0ABS8PEB4_9PSEU|nr:response regulator [Actinomycetospora endophytica]MCD2195830.1 response regulator [Actinomycetospora endophytica]